MCWKNFGSSPHAFHVPDFLGYFLVFRGWGKNAIGVCGLKRRDQFLGVLALELGFVDETKTGTKPMTFDVLCYYVHVCYKLIITFCQL